MVVGVAVLTACGGAISFDELLASQQWEPLCTQDSHCDAGELCEGGVCKPEQRAERREEPACPSGGCDKGYVCVGGVCKLGCQEDTDCGGGYICEGAGEGVLRVCRLGCRVDFDKNTCGGNGYVCRGDEGNLQPNAPGTCKPGCHQPSDCPGRSPALSCVKEEDKPEALGSCHAVECLVGDHSCGTIDHMSPSTCVGIHSQKAGSPGVCRIPCLDRVANAAPCPEGQSCVRSHEAANNEPGICQPGCRSGLCGRGLVCHGHQAAQANQPEVLGTCEPECHITTNNCEPGYICVGKNSQTEGVGTCQPSCTIPAPSAPNPCAAGEACKGTLDTARAGSPGTCQPGCRWNGDCLDGQSCTDFNAGTYNTLGTCRPSCIIVARGARNPCAAGEACKGMWDAAWIGNPGTCQPGCRWDEDCLEEQTCLDFVEATYNVLGRCE